MKRVLMLGFAVTSLAVAANVSFGQGAKGDGHAWKMKKVDVTTQANDLQHQGGSVQVHGLSMLVPVDWSFLGFTTMPPKQDCAYTMGRFNLQTKSPDKSSGLLVFPQTTSFWSDNRMVLQQVEQQNRQPYSAVDCKVEQPSVLADALPKASTMFIPDARTVGAVQPVPGMSERLGAEVQQANQQLGGRSRITAEAGRLKVTGTIDSKPVEAWLIALHTVRFTAATGGGTNQLSDIPLFAIMYAPAGKLESEEKMFSAMLDSIQIDPRWTSYVAQFVQVLVRIRQGALNQVSQIYAHMAVDNANAAAKQQQIQKGVSDYRNNVYSSVASNRSAALDHSSQQFALHMGDQAIYTDSSGQRVQMSNQYGHAWASTTGNTNEYILTDSPSFNPNGQVGSGSWTQMREER